MFFCPSRFFFLHFFCFFSTDSETKRKYFYVFCYIKFGFFLPNQHKYIIPWIYLCQVCQLSIYWPTLLLKTNHFYCSISKTAKTCILFQNLLTIEHACRKWKFLFKSSLKWKYFLWFEIFLVSNRHMHWMRNISLKNLKTIKNEEN